MLIESSHQFDAILNQILSFPHTRCHSSDLCLPQLERISLGSKFKAKTVIILVTFYVRQKYFPLLSWVALCYSYKIRAIKKGEISPRDIACRCWDIRGVAFSSGHLIVMLMASYRGGTDRIKVPNDHSRLVHVAGVMVSNCNFHFLASRGSSIASRASLNIPTQQNRSLSSIYLVL